MPCSSSSSPQLPPNNSHSSLNILLSGDDVMGKQGAVNTARRRLCTASGSLDSPMFPILVGRVNEGRHGGRGIGMGMAMGHGSPRQTFSDQEREIPGDYARPEDQSRLPPFQAFIGNLERRTSR